MPTASLRFEAQFQAAGYSGIVGMDEAGRGAWAGPVVAAAVALDAHLLKARRQLSGLRDSKMMTAAAREELAKQIQELSRAFGIGSASAGEVDGCGLLPATRMAMTRALAALRERGVGMRVDCLLVDSFVLPEERQLLQVSLLKGDQRSLSIAAASVLAKTWRDSWMVQQAKRFPQYGFFQHKGYGTQQHRAALERYGPCALHRLSYQPIRALRS
ncbi:MAG: ribonuclease HII [Chloroflexi bacterium]|nr:ribonuclease HII [Chloroflexota bacterium]